MTKRGGCPAVGVTPPSHHRPRHLAA
jgi:hypothetical protein